MKRLLSIALALVATLSIQAATFTVNTFAEGNDVNPGDGICQDWSGDCSLRSAITEANILAGPDTIIVPPGTYTLVEGSSDDSNEGGDLDIWESLTIIGANGNADGNPSTTIIQARTTPGTFNDRVFHVLAAPEAEVTIQALTVRHGYIAWFDAGGAIATNDIGALTLSNLIIEQNGSRYGDGGALLLGARTVTIEKSIIRDNRSVYREGGAITIGGSAVTIRDSVISGNRAPEGNGGAIHLASGSLTIERSLIANNFANEGGGAIYSAGAVPITVADSTFSGNSANLSGGAVNLTAGSFDATNVTFAGNTSNGGSGGGIANGGGTVVLTNSIFANDPSPFGSNQDISGTVSSASSNNIIGSSSAGGLVNGINGNQVGVDPRLGPLADNGGPTQTHALLAGSPAIDAGTNGTASSQDQRGRPRVLDSSDADATQTVDIGAFEAHPTISDIANQSGVVGLPIAVPFFAGDSSHGLSFSATSSNQLVVPNGNLVFSNTSSHNPTVTVTGTAPGTATITVTVGSNGQSASDTFEVTLTGVADLAIAKTHIDPFREGKSGTYTLSVANIGSIATSGTVTVIDELNPLMIATALSGSGWNCTLATLTCTRSDALAAGASWPPITLTVDLPQGGELTSSATVSGGGDANPTNNSASDTVFVTPASELEVTLAGPATLVPGEAASHTIAVRNLGPSTSSRVYLSVDATAGITYTAAAGTGWSCIAGLTRVRCEVRSLAVGVSSTITATFTVDPTAPAQVTVPATAIAYNDFTQTKNSDTLTITIGREPDVTIAKTHAGNFRQGGTGDYTITVTNSGDGPTSGTITVTDSLPAPLTATAMSGSGWTCALATLTCTTSDALAAGGSLPPITLSVAVAVDAPTDVVNLAYVSGGGETATGNNEAMDGATIVQVADLLPSVTDGGVSFSQGDDARIYEVYVQNDGNAMTDAPVSIAMALSPGLTLDSVTPAAGWTCTEAPLVCSTSDPIWPGAGAFLAATVRVDVAVDAPNPVSLTATLSGGGEAVTSNNVSTDETPVIQMPDLVITKTHVGDFIQGGMATYTIGVSNAGSGPTSSQVTVTDTPPAKVAVSGIGGDGWSCDLMSLTCFRSDPLAPGASYPDITVTGTIDIAAPPTITNTATVSGTDRDSSNNTATDVAIVQQPPDLTISKTAPPSLYAGQVGARYVLTVSNVGLTPTAGEVVVTEVPPAGMTVTSMSGSGWTCDTTTCRRSDALASGASWDPIMVFVDIDLTAAGDITNVATVSGGEDLRVDNNSADATMLVRSFTFTPDVLPPTQFGAAYDQQISVTGDGTPPYTFSISDGMLPLGLTLSVEGRLSGILREAGTFTFTVQSLDADIDGRNVPAWKTYTLTVAPPVIILSPATLPDASFGVLYSQLLTATGGTTPHGFAVTAGALPDGLTLAPNGALSGTPMRAGTFSFTVSATDSTGRSGPFTGSHVYSLTVAKAASTTSIAAAPITYGDTASVIVTVSSPAGGTPSGSVTLTVDGTTALTQTLGSGSTTFSIPSLAGGSHTLAATYAGDANYLASSDATTLEVNRATPTLTVEAPSIVFGNDATIAVTVPNATGTVDLAIDGTTQTQTLSSGIATFTIPGLDAGSHPLTATYPGDTNFEGGSAAGTLEVARAASSVTITSVTPSPSIVGDSVTVSFSFTGEDADATVRAGAYSCTALASAGSCTITFDAVGTYDVVATYAGTSNFEPSTSAPFTHVVEHPIGDAVVSGDATICAGDEVTLVVELTGTAPWTLTWSDGLVETTTATPHQRFVGVHETTVYTLTAASDAYRAMSISGSAQVTVRDPLAAPTIDGPAEVILGEPFELEASRGYDSYQWYRNGRMLANATSRRLEIGAAAERDLASYTVVGYVSGCVSPRSSELVVGAIENETLIATIVGSADGANGSRFRSALHLFNRNDAAFEGALSFVDASAGGGAAATILDLLPMETRWYGDLFGGNGLASADLAILHGRAPFGLVHVYNDLGENGTTGLLQPLVDASLTLVTRDRAVLIAPADPVATRFNIGIRTLTHGASLRYTVRDASGVTRATADRVFPPSFFAHMSAAQFTGVEPGPSDSIEIELTGGSAIVYGASTDNVTNDPNIQFAQRVASSAEVRRVIPVVGSTEGAFGSRFRTSLQLFNSDDETRSASVTVRPHGVMQTFTIEPRATLAIDDLLPAMGLEGLGTADLVSNPSVAAVVRVFNDGEGETSMTEELIDEDQILAAGDVATILGPHDPSMARFNIGVRAFEEGATLLVTVRSPQGVVVATRELVLGPHHFQHTSALDATGHAFTGDESVTISVTAGRTVIYGVWTDNITNDPGFHVAE